MVLDQKYYDDVIDAERMLLSRIPLIEHEFIWQCRYSSDPETIKKPREKLEETYKNLEIVRLIKDEMNKRTEKL